MASRDDGFNKLAHWAALNPAIGEVTRVLVHRYCRLDGACGQLCIRRRMQSGRP
jgi:hypothetical protein